jgi:hypothetical protein
MPTLAQVNAVLTSKKAQTEKAVTALHKESQKAAAYDGLSRVYSPTNAETGERLPPETKVVQLKAEEVVTQVMGLWQPVWDLTATQDAGNQQAAADVVVDDVVVLKAVPVTTLLYLDKHVNDLYTFVEKLPTPDPGQVWTRDPNAGVLRTAPKESVRTNKEPTVIVKYDATDKHPAQTELFTKDVPVGTWTQTLFSGALPADTKAQWLDRIGKLQAAIKTAREEANSRKVDRVEVARDLFAFAFGAEIAGRLPQGSRK